MALSDVAVPSNLGRHFPTVSDQQRIYRYITDDINRLVDNDDLLTSPAVGADFTLANGGVHGDPCPRVLVATQVNVATGDDRGIVVDIWGETVFGPRHERLDFGSHAASTTRVMFTRYAYLYVKRVVYVARNGAALPITLDRFDLGITHVSGTVVGTLVTTNGSAAGRYRGVGLPIPVTSGINTQGVASADFETEVFGCFIEEDGTSGVSTATVLDRTGEFLVDNGHAVFVPAEEFAATAGNIALELWIHSRLGI